VFRISWNFGRPGSPARAEVAHHQLDGAPSHGDLAAQHQLGVDASGAVGLAGLVMHATDDIGEHRVAHAAR